jgi:hypothetical protein
LSKGEPNLHKQEAAQTDDGASISLKSLNIQNEGPIGIEFCSSIDNFSVVVKEFVPGGIAKTADPHDLIQKGDILTSVNDIKIIEGKGPWIEKSYNSLQMHGLSRPLTLGFSRPYMTNVVIEKSDSDLESDGPEEMLLREKKIGGGVSKIFVDGFHGVDGVAESSGVMIGDNLIFVNGMPVGAGVNLRPGCSILDLKSVKAMLEDSKSYPMCVHFARQASTEHRTVDFDVNSDSIKTFSVTISKPHQLGCTINQVGLKSAKFVVQQFHAVSGVFHKIISSSVQSNYMKDTSFHSINGEILPSYASCDMVMNAMKRGWKSGKLDIVFCDERTKGQLTGESQI